MLRFCKKANKGIVNGKTFLHISLLEVLFWFVFAVQAEGRNFVVVIDPGHGGRDAGTSSGVIAKEKDVNLAVALQFGKMISGRHNDVQVIYTRQTDRFVDLNERAHIANRNKADLFISIHANSTPGKQHAASVRGTETYTLGLAQTDENLQVAMRENSVILLEEDYTQNYKGFDPNSTESYIIFEFMQDKYLEQSIFLASEIQKEFVASKRVNRGVRQAGLLVLRETGMPSVLVELGYMSNREEERYMASAAGQAQLSKALYQAFARYKQAYDRKQGLTPEALPVTPAGQTVYKVQILASYKKLPAKSRELKGYSHTAYFVENGMYKYTYGESHSLEEIRQIRKSVLKDFKDAFIISFKEGKKVSR